MCSSMFLMGKLAIVAERHRKLARHNVPGKMSNNNLASWKDAGSGLVFERFHRPFRDGFNCLAFSGDVVPG